VQATTRKILCFKTFVVFFALSRPPQASGSFHIEIRVNLVVLVDFLHKSGVEGELPAA